jgi:hypothetical protein
MFNARLLALASALLALALPAHADPGYYLVSVYEDEGRTHIDYRYWTIQLNGSQKIVWPELGIGYGVTKRWYTELFTSYEGTTVANSQPSTVNWQNDYLLTQGQYDIDVALHSNLVMSQEGPDADALEFGPVFQTDVGRTQLNANLIFEKSLTPGNSAAPKLKYQWQAKYRFNPLLHVGLQGFGEVGTWNQWSESGKQSHRWGPVVAGSWDLGNRKAVEYQLAFLKGSVYGGLPGEMLSFRLQYLY